MKKAIFTVLIGNYDTLIPAPKYEGWDCVLITDQELLEYKGWVVVKVPEGDRKASRMYKLLSHIYMPDYDLVCYIDANVQLMSEPPSNPAYFSHPQRTRINQEARAIITSKKDDVKVVNDQLLEYRRAGFMDNRGLFCNRVFIRDNKDEKIKKLYDDWWQEIKRHSYRDQLSLPYVLWKNNIRLPVAPYFLVHRKIKVFKHQPHKVNVHYITPACPHKLYGKAINDIVKHLPDEDWICLRDIDTIPLNHSELIPQIERIISTHGGAYDCFGAMTNDLGLRYQLPGGDLSRTYNLEDHRIITDELRIKHGIEVENNRHFHIGGFFMLFSKRIWNKTGGFIDEVYKDGHFFDFHFSRAIKKVGGKIGIAKGVYIYHFCRYGKERGDSSHLH